MAGKLLLAMPGMDDLRFRKAVIYLISHHSQGAMGIVISQPLTELSFEQLVKEAGLETVDVKRQNVELLNGGPVEIQHGFLIHTPDFVHENTIKVDERISVSANLEALQAFAEGECPQEGVLALGYAGWGPGQLERELQESLWLIADADYNLLFNMPRHAVWDRAYARIGIDPASVSLETGRA
ncbi:MAG: YqgE/AlgH family protein [Pseudobdellovibrionaceae bacterium]|nr:YqgE/AlgH family protein [Pseudobdellovibrionaceae bacterium]